MSELPLHQKKTLKKSAIDALWRKGVLRWKLDANQVVMQDFCTNLKDRKIIIACSRRLGKSWFLCSFAIETCLKSPDTIVKFIAPTTKDIKRIITPLIKKITEDCPEDLIPRYKSQENVFRFPNGSEIQLAGTDNGHAESIRGTAAHLCIVDEAGFCSDLEYIVSSILLPTMTDTGGKLVMASTPSRSPDHDFMKFWTDAEAEGRCIVRTIYDNPRLSKEQIEEIEKEQGGKDSVSFRREYLVERIISEEDAVIPEFTKDLRDKIIVPVTEKPEFYDRYVAMDIGFRDLTVVLFAYYDFRQSKVIIQDELVLRGTQVISDILAAQIRAKERALWSNPLTGETVQPLLRIADNNNPILLNELQLKHNLTFLPTLKDQKEAALNHMRILIKSEQVIIDPRCTTLIAHLSSAVWDRAKGLTYGRSSDKGHYDAVDALLYLCRNINFSKNPYPAGYQFSDKSSVFYAPGQQQTNPNASSFERGLVEQFKVINRKKAFRRF